MELVNLLLRHGSLVLALMLILITCHTAVGVEFTFDLSDNSEDCFYENIPTNTTSYLEYHVTAGGQLDVDVVLKDPNNQIIYENRRSTFDSHQFITTVPGTYVACFSNQFSSFSHKFVYLNFQVGDEPPLPGVGEHAQVLTQMETSAQSIHKSLNDILDAQTHHRLREAHGRKRAEELNERVMWWSSLETAAMLLIGIGQIIILRNFFSDRKPSQVKYGRL